MDLTFDPMSMNDHSSEVGRSDVICEEIPDVDEQCVADHLVLGTPLGPFAPPLNDCQTNAYDILQRCRWQIAFPSGGSEGAPGDPGYGGTRAAREAPSRSRHDNASSHAPWCRSSSTGPSRTRSAAHLELPYVAAARACA